MKLSRKFVYEHAAKVFDKLKWYKDADGYMISSVYIYGKNFVIKRSRLIFFINNGNLPKEVDHKNGIRDDDSPSNLRAATRSQNLHNTSKPSSNTSGIKGIHLCKQTNKWYAKLKLNGVVYFVGRFDDIEDAVVALNSKREELHGSFAKR